MDALDKIWHQQWLSLPGGNGVTAGQVMMVLVLLLGGYLVARFLGYLLGRKLATTRIRPDVIHVIKRVVFLMLIIIIVLMALAVLGIPLTAFAFATGAIAIGVGFGAQNIINNFISGWILMAERPIRIDDFIELEGAHGTVERIGTRSTRVRRTDGVHLLVPNSLLLERTVVNWTLMDKSFRTVVRVGVEYGAPVDKVLALIAEVVDEHALIRKEPKPVIIFEDFGENALIFEAYFWADVSTGMELRQIRSDCRVALAARLRANDIAIAMPRRALHMATDISIAERTTSS